MSGVRGAAVRAPVPVGLHLLQVRRAAAAPFVGSVRLWRRSLQLRTVTFSVLLSTLALVVVGTYMSYSIGQGLFQDRLGQVLKESAGTNTTTQGVFDSATSTDPSALRTLSYTAVERATSTATGLYDLALLCSPPGADPSAVCPVQDIGRQSATDLISTQMKAAVGDPAATQYWQSIAIPVTGGVHPGVVVGSTVRVGPSQYELYLFYDVDDVQTTLDSVQRTLALGGLALVALIAAVTLLVVRLVVVPIRQAAAVSEELAAGHLERRIPERGTDVVATLARSFNRMADGLQRQITQLANLSQVQQRFVSDVSHELRTPLTTIRLASEVLHTQRGQFEPPVARSAELLRAQVERFELLLGDLLEISRMDAQAAEVRGEPTSLVALAQEAIDGLGGLAAETGSEMRLVAPGGHAEVEVDARRISRIVRNLLANALEHGEGRPVVVTVDSSASAVGLGVRDYGIGMRPEDAERVFDRFWRADPSRQRRIGGTGLGLAISLEDAVLHGGTLEVWSRPREGTNFVLTLPRVLGRPQEGRPVPVRPGDAGALPEAPASEHRPRRLRAGRRPRVRS